jgi:hypothetical protein
MLINLVEIGMAKMAETMEMSALEASMARVFLRKACRIEMVAQKVLVASAEPVASAVSAVSAASAVLAALAALTVLAAKEMVSEVSRSRKKVIIPLSPTHPSEAQPHTVVLLPFWLAGGGQAVGVMWCWRCRWWEWQWHQAHRERFVNCVPGGFLRHIGAQGYGDD